MSEQPYYQVLRDEASREVVHHWWQRLRGNPAGGRSAMPPAARAILRRSRAVDDTLLTEGFRQLWFALPANLRKGWRMPAWGTVAAVLADVETHVAAKSFAATLGAQTERGSGKPFMSELRFSQLQHSHDLDELLRRLRRAVHLLDRATNVLSLADDILHWHQEQTYGPDIRPQHHLPVRWATEYFTELSRYHGG
ncbi:MAG TPA: type I-E CRISPR-associated protein Cse2/CasB [Halothiobacillus sp.]|nr:type I-E CRISPR-associated protein Cse2/CasB [Halothiobacillus sp.]